MSDSQATPTGGMMTFEVDFDGGRGAAGSNGELKGRGQLAIDPHGPVFSFTGLRRRLFSGERITVELGAGDIANATLEGRTIRFAARPRAPGAPLRAFVFHCRDEADARAVFQHLPARELEGFAEARDFLQRLDDLAGARPAWATVTGAIIALNAAAFVAMAGFLGAGWVTPDDLTAYIRYGANNGAATTDGEWWRLLTSMFLHYGILHLALNMWALFNTGMFLEKLQGRVLFAITYFGSGLAGGFASILWNGDRVWSAGASGAVFGVIGAIAGFAVRERQSIPRNMLRGMMSSSLAFAGYNILFGFSIPGIDNAAHLGGLAGGFALGWLLAMPVDAAARRRLVATRILAGLAALAVICAAGVRFTPRFDYRVADELALRDALSEFGPIERKLAEEHNLAIATLRKDGDVTAFVAWLDCRFRTPKSVSCPFHASQIDATVVTSIWLTTAGRGNSPLVRANPPSPEQALVSAHRGGLHERAPLETARVRASVDKDAPRSRPADEGRRARRPAREIGKLERDGLTPRAPRIRRSVRRRGSRLAQAGL